MVDLKMVSDRMGVTVCGKQVPVGTAVEYCGHVPGGMVQVRLEDGKMVVMHPHCFKELR